MNNAPINPTSITHTTESLLSTELSVREARKKDLMKEIDLIQSVINRMAHNSFLIKGWGLTLITLVLSLQKESRELYLAFIPLISFWSLDAYFLRQERLFRHLYKWVVENRLHTDEGLFNLNPVRFVTQEQPHLRVMFSITLVLFYGLTALLILLYILTHWSIHS